MKSSREAMAAGFAALMLISVNGAFADEFSLKSGKVVRGAVVSQNPTEYVVRTEVGTIKVLKADITRTVTMGTTAAEVEGDVAAAKFLAAQKEGNAEVAREQSKVAMTHYRQALTEVPGGTPAADRLQVKIAQVSETTQQAAIGAVAGQFAQANDLLKARQYDSAEALLNKIQLQISPADPLTTQILKLQAQIHYGRARAAQDAVKVEVSRQEYEEAIMADPTFYPAYIDLGESLLGNSSTASRGVDLIEQGLAIAGTRLAEQQRYNYLYLLAGKYFDQGNFAKAAAAYSQLIPGREKYPAYADALDKAVESYVRMGEENLSSDFRETITNLNIALKLNPSNQKALFLLGRIYLDLGQLENAIVCLKNLVSLSPSYEEANHYLGKAYFLTRDYDAAIRYLTTEIEAHPNSFFTFTDRAEVHIAMGNFTAAQADINTAQALDANHWYSYYLEGLLAFRQNDYASARTALVEALDKKRTAMPIHLLMGQVLMKQNEAEGARRWFEQVANSLQNVENLSYRYSVYRAEALTYLGQLAVQENSPRQAANYLNEALQTVPDFAPAMAAMADAALLMANDPSSSRPREVLYSDAEKLYTKAIEKDPNNAEYYFKLATFYHKYQVNHEKARTNYNLYVDKGGKNPQVNAMIVEVGGTARPELVTTATAVVTSGTVMTSVTDASTSGLPALGASATTTTAVMVPGAPAVPGQPGAMTPMVPVTVTTTTAVAVPAVPVAVQPVAPVVPVAPAVPGAPVVPAAPAVPGQIVAPMVPVPATPAPAVAP